MKLEDILKEQGIDQINLDEAISTAEEQARETAKAEAEARVQEALTQVATVCRNKIMELLEQHREARKRMDSLKRDMEACNNWKNLDRLQKRLPDVHVNVVSLLREGGISM